MDQMIIVSAPTADKDATESARVVLILRYLRERLDCLTADVISLMSAINSGDPGAIRELEADIRNAYDWPDLGN